MDFRESDLVLNVSKNVDPAVWDEGKYAKFFDILFKNRTYQREATEVALRYMNSLSLILPMNYILQNSYILMQLPFPLSDTFCF